MGFPMTYNLAPSLGVENMTRNRIFHFLMIKLVCEVFLIDNLDAKVVHVHM